MEKLKIKMLPIAILALSVSFFAVWPTFRTAAQKTDKPANSPAIVQKDSTGKPNAGSAADKNAQLSSQDVEKIMQEVKNALKGWQKEWPNVKMEIEKALKEVDIQKINAEVQASLAAADFDKIHTEIETSLKEIDSENINAEVAQAMKGAAEEIKLALKDIDGAKISTEIKQAMAAIDWKKIDREMADAKGISAQQIKKQMAEAKLQMAQSSVQLKESLKNAKVALKNAMAQLKWQQEGLQQLEKDGLIKKGENGNVEYKNGLLYLNGAAQSQEISNKYKKYFEQKSNNSPDSDE